MYIFSSDLRLGKGKTLAPAPILFEKASSSTIAEIGTPPQTPLPSLPSPVCESARLPQAQHRRALLQEGEGKEGKGGVN